MVSDNHSVPRIYEYFAWGTTIRQLEQLYSIHYYTIITLHVSSLLYKQRDPKLPFPVATHTHTNPSHSWPGKYSAVDIVVNFDSIVNVSVQIAEQDGGGECGRVVLRG